MKKIYLPFLLLALLNTPVFAQKTINDPNAQPRTVSGFHAVNVSGGIDLYLTQSNAEAVAVSASKTEYRDKIKTTVENGVLKIWYNNDRNIKIDWGNKKMKAYVSVKNIDGLEGSGGSDIEIDGTLKASKLILHISGGSDFEGRVDVDNLNIDQSGGSDINISGRAINLVIDASGGSDFSGYDLASDNCRVEASGGSDVTITVNKELNATASGGSDVHYKGNASIKNVKSSGSSIKKVSK